MTLELKVSERSLLKGKRKWEEKVLGVIKTRNKHFYFGRNADTKSFIKTINSYPFLIETEKEQRVFSEDDGRYTFSYQSQWDVSVRTNLSFWIFHFGESETVIEQKTAFEIQVGDKLVFRGANPKIEVVIEVLALY